MKQGGLTLIALMLVILGALGIIFVFINITFLGKTETPPTNSPNNQRLSVQNTSNTPAPSSSALPPPSPSASPIGSLSSTNTSSPKTTTQFSLKVLLLIYNPIIESQSSKKIVQVKGWNDPEQLSNSFINSLKDVSGGIVNYSITQKVEIDGFPVKTDGFIYTDENYLDCTNSGGGRCHNPDLASYQKMIEVSDACTKRDNGEIDELWIWGGPWFGYWESNLAGPNAFWYNSSPTTGTTCNQLLPIMGFNYERGEAEMFEDLAHRIESTLQRVYGSWSANENHPWNKFSLLDRDKPGRGGCGNAHDAVNAALGASYDRTNTRTVKSSCEDFLNYPNLTSTFKDISCTAWGCNGLGYLKWWFSHLPKASGSTDEKLNNWWEYLVNPEEAL